MTEEGESGGRSHQSHSENGGGSAGGWSRREAAVSPVWTAAEAVWGSQLKATAKRPQRGRNGQDSQSGDIYRDTQGSAACLSRLPDRDTEVEGRHHRKLRLRVARDHSQFTISCRTVSTSCKTMERTGGGLQRHVHPRCVSAEPFPALSPIQEYTWRGSWPSMVDSPTRDTCKCIQLARPGSPNLVSCLRNLSLSIAVNA